jgi:hypothetical protein
VINLSTSAENKVKPTNRLLPMNTLSQKPPAKLRCPDCDNSPLFVEIMDFESHLVNGDLTYVRLLDAVTDRYICYECSESIEPGWLTEQKRPMEFDN